MISTLVFKNRDVEEASSDVTNWRGRIRRTPAYYIALVLLFIGTLLVLISLFTNNWIRSTSPKNDHSYSTFGLWFMCRRYGIDWYRHNVNHGLGQGSYYNSYGDYCQTIDYNSGQIFYTIAGVINFFALTLGLLGICIDVAKNKLFVPTILVWALAVSVGSQLIGVSVYGGVGVGWDSVYVPDYSMILASVALCINFFATVVFVLEIMLFKRRLVGGGYA